MPWGKTEEKPPEKKPEETKTELSGDALLAKMSELLAPLATSIETFKNETNTRFEAIAKLNEKPAERRDPASLLDDEQKWTEEKLGPIAIATVNANARITENEIFSELREGGWSEFIPAIKETLSKTPIQVKAEGYEGYVRNVVDMIIGRESRKNGLKRKGNSFILEDASSSTNNDQTSQVAQADKDFLNFEVVTSKGKHVKRGEFLERMGIDVHDPEQLKKVRETWSKVQVVN